MIRTTITILCIILFIAISSISQSATKTDKGEKVPSGNNMEIEFYCLFGVEYHMVKTTISGKITVLPAGPVWKNDGKISSCDENEDTNTGDGVSKGKQ